MIHEILEDITYLGDGVYVGRDGYHVWLLVHDGTKTTNAIALDPNVLNSLALWIRRTNDKTAND
jgi:hypothetical protein